MGTVAAAKGEIARRLGYSGAQYVDALLSLASAPLAVRRMVMESVISATTAIEAVKKHGDKAGDVLLAAMVKSGTGRVTAKHMPDAAFKKTLKKQAEPMHKMLTSLMDDPGYKQLSTKFQKALVELLGSIKRPK